MTTLNDLDQLFVLLITGGGNNIWIGTTTRKAYNLWLYDRAALVIQYPRGFILQGDPNSKRIMVNIGPPYIGDTTQLEVALFPMSVEIIGTVTEDTEHNSKSCSGNNSLFQNYLDAVIKWRAALANIVTASPGDLSNITQFPPRM